jgi:hypothetical protein
MKFRLVYILLLCISMGTYGQPPISSLYQNMSGGQGFFVKNVYLLLHQYYENKLSVKTLEERLSGLGTAKSPREKAVLNLALSYTKNEEEDFGFYNLRLAANEAESLPDDDIIKGVVFAEFGNYLFNRETHDLAIEFLRRSIPLLERNKPAGLEGAGFSLLNKMLRSFIQLGENDSVAVYMNQLISHAAQYKNKIWISSAYNNKGYRFYENGLKDSAMACYLRARQYLDTTITEHLLFYENINENIAHIHADAGTWALAMALQEKVIATRLRFPGNNIAVIKGLGYFTEYCEKSGQSQLAIQKFEQCRPLLEPYPPAYTTTTEYLKLRMKLAQLAGNQSDYVSYFKQMLEKEKQKLDADKQLLVHRKGINKFIKSRNALFEQQLEIERLQKARLRQSVSYRNILLGILLLVSGIIVYGIYRSGKYKKQLLEERNEKLQQREKILDLENINLKNNIELKQKDIARVVADNKLRTEVKKDFLKKLELLGKADENKVKNEIRKLRIEMGQAIENYDKVNLLQHNIDEINAEFEGKLRQAIPGITQSEIDICGFIRLRYNNTEIANITQKTPENVRVNKFRIKQKAGLTDMKDLEQLLKEL